MPAFVGVGEVLWDLLPSGRQLGGAPANFAYHAHALGAEGIAVSCVGDDDPGKEILDCLGSLSLDTEHIAIDGRHPTGTVSVEVDNAGVPSYRIQEDVAWDFIPESEAMSRLAGAADAVCFGSLAQRNPVSRATIRAFLRKTRPSALRIFDVNLRQDYYDREVIEASLRLANVLKLNEDELQLIAGLLALGGPTDELATDLSRRFDLSLVALTKGPHGSVLYERGRQSRHPGVSTEVVDTVGAGDAFTAALTLGIWRGLQLDRLSQVANRVAAYVCTQAGATPTMPEEIRGLFG